MKKYAKLILILGLAGTLLTGCTKKEAVEEEPAATPEPTEEAVVEETPTPEVIAAEEPEPTEEPIPEGYCVSYLTGESRSW